MSGDNKPKRQSNRSEINTKKGLSDFTIYGKIPPQAIDLEEAVLGAAMLEREGAEVILRLLFADVFYKEEHKIIFKAIRSLWDQSNPIDILTVTEHLRKTSELDLVGGAYYITTLTNRVASAANIEYHSKIIIEKWVLREVIRISSEAINIAFSESGSIEETISYIDKGVLGIDERLASGGNMKHISIPIKKAREEAIMRELLAKEGRCTGITTGLVDLDNVTKGWQKSELIIIASRPGMGKTASMLKFAKSAALNSFCPCIYSLEMSDVSLANRLILSEADIDSDKYHSGLMNEHDWDEFRKAEIMLSDLPIYVDDNPLVSMRYVRSHSRLMKKKGHCDLIILDYLQLADVKIDNEKRNREQEIAQASRQAKILAKELNIPVILLSQLNRACEVRGGTKRPILSDLRESGAIEQDADKVIFIYRPAYYGIKDDEGGDSFGLGEYIIAKNREGATLDIAFRHNISLTKIWDYSNEEIPMSSPATYVNNIIEELKGESNTIKDLYF